jgi:predicted Zn-dependent protease with MMP-like domain
MEILAVAYQVSKARFGELIESALRELPEEFENFVEEVPIEVRDSPTEAQLKSAHVGPGGLLLGLYVGRPRTLRNVEDSVTVPDVIYIFQEPIQKVCADEAQLASRCFTKSGTILD